MHAVFHTPRSIHERAQVPQEQCPFVTWSALIHCCLIWINDIAVASVDISNTARTESRPIYQRTLNKTEMTFARKTMAFIVALSVALLPIGAPIVSATQLYGHGDVANVSMPSDGSIAMDDCCPESQPCEKNSVQCQLMTSCAVHSKSSAHVDISYIQYPSVQEATLPALADNAGPSYAGSPLFRPPRV